MSDVTKKEFLAARRDPDNASDEALMAACHNRYIHRKLADPEGNYLVIADEALKRVSALCKKHGIYEELKALEIDAVPYDMDVHGE